MKILCTICARGGSKGVPKKNIRLLCGKPLITYTIQQALDCSMINMIVLSTDSQEIVDISRQYNIDIPFLRPVELATDSTPKLPVIQHLVSFYVNNSIFAPDYVIDLDPTSPLRTKEDIEKCLSMIIYDQACDSVITGYMSNKNPYFNMVELNDNGYVRLSKEAVSTVTCRQQSPVVYAMNASIYVWRTEILLNQKHVVSGSVKLVEMPEDRSIDIDTEFDFVLVELLMNKKMNNDIS
ncbi:MAG: acylneuraminate cytidylyltransferase family protein [Nitrospirae bacterium]|nr:acylneuraminate cytidylyltransferase family protein [Nitrospirota bacterium]